MVKLYHSLSLKPFDRLEIQLRAKHPERIGFELQPTATEVGYIKTIYASLPHQPPELF